MIFCSQIFSTNPAESAEVNLYVIKITVDPEVMLLGTNWRDQRVNIYNNKDIMECYCCKRNIEKNQKFIRYHITNNYYHITCFTCVKCKSSLIQKPFRYYNVKEKIKIGCPILSRRLWEGSRYLYKMQNENRI